MTNVMARRWIKRIPEGRGLITAGAKALLQELWDCVPENFQHDTDGSHRFPSRKRLAEETGSTIASVKLRLRKLESLGWIRRVRSDGWMLAWHRSRPDWAVEDRSIPGFVYALEFSNGGVKVGRTADPSTRIATHRTSAAQFMLSVVREHVVFVSDMTLVENTVIAMLATSHQRASGSEWFVGGYDLAVQALSTWSPMDGAEDTEES